MNSKSTEIGSIAKALAKARNEFQHIEKTAEVAVRLNSGGQYKFKYAPLEEIYKKIVPALSKNGISFYQTISSEGGNKIITTVIHESGQWFDTELPYANHPPDPQKLGGLITYMKRYAICMTFGIQADDDNDANDVSDKTKSFEVNNKPKHQPKPSRPEPIVNKPDNYGDPKVRKELLDEIMKQLGILSEGMSKEQKVDLLRAQLKISSIHELSAWPIKELRDGKNRVVLAAQTKDIRKKIKTTKDNTFKI